MKKLAALIMIALLNCMLSSAIPVPHGIGGSIFELDGITPVPSGTRFSINNTDNGFYLEGQTGNSPSPGKYFASVSGDDGDNIIITAWGSEHSGNLSVALLGVMNNVNLLINMSSTPHAPTISSTPATTTDEGDTYAYAVSAEDEDGSILHYMLSESPAGMAISSQGVVNWQPDQQDVGENSISIVVTDGTFNATQDFTITVSNTQDAPQIESEPDNMEITAGSTYSYDVDAYDLDDDQLTYLLTQAPSGMSINATSGNITWTPSNSDVGYHAVEVTVTDSHDEDSQSYTLQVSPVRNPPAIISVPATTATENTTYHYDVDATDADGDILNYTLSVKPQGMTISSSSGLITWMPLSGDAGITFVTVNVTDGILSMLQSYSLNVTPINHLPVITSLPQTTGRQDQPYFYDLDAYDADDSDLFDEVEHVYSVVSAPNGFTINPSNGHFSGTPNSSSVGILNITLGASDETGTTIQTFALLVENVNDRPVITSAPQTSADQGSAYSYAVAVNDPDNDALQFSLASAPAGMLIDSSSGLILWTPGQENLGSHYIELCVTDGEFNATQNYTLTVENVNDAPVITTSPVLNVSPGETYLYDVNATDADNNTLNYSLASMPAGMAINNETGLINWTPTTTFLEYHNIAVIASDGNLTAEQDYVLTVLGPAQSAGNAAGSGSSTVSAGAGGGATGFPGTKKIAITETAVSEITIDFSSYPAQSLLEIKQLTGRPSQMPDIGRRVYQYLEVKTENISDENVNHATIKFTVTQDWLRKNSLQPENVALFRFRNGWNELPTTIDTQDGNSASYSAITPGFSVFAIAVKKEVAPEKVNEQLNATITDQRLPQVYSVTGAIAYSGNKKPVETGTGYTLVNTRTGQAVSASTTEKLPGIFSAIIEARKGDVITLIVGESNAEGNFILSGDMSGLYALLDTKSNTINILPSMPGTTGNRITGRIVAFTESQRSLTAAFSFLLAVIAAVIWWQAASRKKIPKKGRVKKRR